MCVTLLSKREKKEEPTHTKSEKRKIETTQGNAESSPRRVYGRSAFCSSSTAVSGTARSEYICTCLGDPRYPAPTKSRRSRTLLFLFFLSFSLDYSVTKRVIGNYNFCRSYFLLDSFRALVHFPSCPPWSFFFPGFYNIF